MLKNLLLVCILSPAFAQNAPETKPKLVVGIVVDQMRQEYLYRFAPKFGNAGFKRLMSEGFMLRNAHYNYVPTVTGPGHASIYTGATPSTHGIISNAWYDKELKKSVNCVFDDRHQTVGVEKLNAGVSPWRMLSSTITDELKVFTQKKAKVIGLSIKDRGAVLPAGHAADGAYWYDGGTGKFISSTYYKPGLPLWLEKFNNLKLPDQFLSQTWNTLLPISEYVESGPDDSPYESLLAGKEKATFPYNLSELRKLNGNYDLLSRTPFGDDVLAELAKAAMEGEGMGADDVTDFLCLSFSSPDIIGHAVGPNAIELEDTYVRLDRNIADLLQTLDKKVGQGQYLVFLTSDHGVAEVPKSMIDLKVPAGYFDMGKMEKGLNDYLGQYFPGAKLVEQISNHQVFLDHSMFRGDPKSSGVDLLIVSQLISRYLLSLEGISRVFTKSSVQDISLSDQDVGGMIARGFHPKRSGDIAFDLASGWFSGTTATGTTHGSGYSYDTHVPILFFGMGINQGTSDQYHPITDIAPTLSVLLKIKFPSGCQGQPIVEAIKR
jgi:predicted AlkP superfamily pyrophosphatase or phosphodiesterase